MTYVGTLPRTKLMTNDTPAKPIVLRCQLPIRDRRILNKESLGIDGKCYLALFAGDLARHDLQGSLDALGPYRHPESRGATTHLDRDPYHLLTPSFHPKIAMIITYQLYFTVLTVSSEIKSRKCKPGLTDTIGGLATSVGRDTESGAQAPPLFACRAAESDSMMPSGRGP